MHVAGLAREYDPHHLLTIGWSTAQAAHTHIEGIDFVSFHYYNATTNFASTYASLQASFPTQPIVLEEFGLSTWNSWFFPGGHSTIEQGAYYAAILHVLRTTRNSGYVAWTLYDFSYVPAMVAGQLPWQSGPQKGMGILSNNGQVKLAAHLLTPGAPLSVPPDQHPVQPFGIILPLMSLLALYGIRLLRKRRHPR